MSQERSDGEIVAAGDGAVQVKLASLVKDGGHRGGSDDFGHGREIEDGVGGHDGRVWREGVASKRPECDEFSLMDNGQGSRRECVGADGFLEDVEGRTELLILAREIERERQPTCIAQITKSNRLPDCKPELVFCCHRQVHSVFPNSKPPSKE